MYIKLRKVFVHTSLNHPVDKQGSFKRAINKTASTKKELMPQNS